MTLRELLQSVDAEAYASVPLFEELLNTKPEYGSGNRIEVKLVNGEIAVSNVHVGSLGDIVACHKLSDQEWIAETQAMLRKEIKNLEKEKARLEQIVNIIEKGGKR